MIDNFLFGTENLNTLMLRSSMCIKTESRGKMVPPPQILITSPLLDLESNQVPEITVTREVEGEEEEEEVGGEEEEEGETASQIPFRGVSLETGPRQDQRTELFIRQRLAGLGLAPAPACRRLLT